MRYLDLQNRYNSIQESKKKFMEDEISYIKNALKANGEIEDTRLNVINLDRLEQDYPECIIVSEFPMRIKKVYMDGEDIKFVVLVMVNLRVRFITFSWIHPMWNT